ncbi:GTP cyclohydrolase FolE2 [Parvibium lacunae]|uniref:GTP cyclohydrolase FolE2 n=1 Tax=Parvibium lacunae TaxID=1888893 RepID=A0A368L0Q2_9BURK|nr:GTP cyclohydrolase FolE2 [Parvibium lacunae]RCS57141.1 GTP cyclohydrolase I FolE2 [Parvibium lacunae]
MNAPEKLFLPDVQNHLDTRNLVIQRVGVKSIVHPVQLRTAAGVQPSVAHIDMYVRLPAEVKGTHMSRFLEVLQEQHDPLSYDTLQTLMRAMLLKLDATCGYIEMRFPYFIQKTAPVSGVASLLDYQVTLRAEVVPSQPGVVQISQQVLVPVTSLCPCSKKISDYGAHNQRSHVTINLQLNAPLAIEEQVRIAEDAASCELWGLLKRPDEKWVTERAYDNPKFVEDLVRDIALKLQQDARVQRFTVESENFESIHNHSAYALIEG